MISSENIGTELPTAHGIESLGHDEEVSWNLPKDLDPPDMADFGGFPLPDVAEAGPEVLAELENEEASVEESSSEEAWADLYHDPTKATNPVVS